VDGEVGWESVDVVTSENVEGYACCEVFVCIQRNFVGAFARVSDFRLGVSRGRSGCGIDSYSEGKEQREG
jgi:hypothetical protein